MLPNLFSSISNNNNLFKSYLIVPKQKQSIQIIDLLFQEGLVRRYKVLNNKIYIFLKYKDNLPLIKKIDLISSSKRRRFVKIKEVQKLPFNKIYLISTSKGIVTHTEAQKINLGGELICSIDI